jgi:lipoate-protein ligase A
MLLDREGWRLLDYSFDDPFMNLALEESILRGKVEGQSLDTLRLWQHPRVISIGCFLNPEDEVNVGACKQLGLRIIRRLSPGGALYIDEGSIQYSLTFDNQSLLLPERIEDSYSVLSGGVIEALNSMGVKARFQPINDLVVGGKKISGASQSRMYNGILHHGTISVNTKLDILEQVLKPSELKLKAQGFPNLKERITTLSREIGRDVSMEVFKRKLVEGFERTLNLDFEVAAPSPWEIKTAKELYEEKYRKFEWIFSETKPRLDVFSSYKAAKGLIRVSLSLSGDRIEDLKISGGFILHPENAVQELEQGLRGEVLDEEALRERILRLFAVKGIQTVGVSAEDFARAIMLAYLEFVWVTNSLPELIL